MDEDMLRAELAAAKATIARMQPLVLCAQEVAMPLSEATRRQLLDAANIECIARLANRLDSVADAYAMACEEAAATDDAAPDCDLPRIVMTSREVRVELPASAAGLPIRIEVGVIETGLGT